LVELFGVFNKGETLKVFNREFNKLRGPDWNFFTILCSITKTSLVKIIKGFPLRKLGGVLEKVLEKRPLEGFGKRL